METKFIKFVASYNHMSSFYICTSNFISISTNKVQIKKFFQFASCKKSWEKLKFSQESYKLLTA